MVTKLARTIYPFDAEIALAEADNAEKLFVLHLSRCDDGQTAEKLQQTFSRLANKFEQKKLELETKVK